MNALHKMTWLTIALLTISGQAFAVCENEVNEVVRLTDDSSKCNCMPGAEVLSDSAGNPVSLDTYKKLKQSNIDSDLNTYLNEEPSVIDWRIKQNEESQALADKANCNDDGMMLYQSKICEGRKAVFKLERCILRLARERRGFSAKVKINSTQPQSSSSEHQQQSTQDAQQQAQQQAQLAQRDAQQAQQQAQLDAQQAQQRQARADQDRKGKRRRHEPENVATECLSVDVERPGFGGFINKCNFQVWYVFCNLNPKEGSWAEAHDCVKHYGAAGQVGANGFSAAHVKNTETVYFYACKEPAWALDDEYVPGQGIAARCHTVGGN